MKGSCNIRITDAMGVFPKQSAPDANTPKGGVNGAFCKMRRLRQVPATAECPT